ncbi:pyridoxal-phosphate dependent enzyme family protein [Olavius algarvensis Delta 1 endosymbiont]|nr:pyridoxal-phosphate dependent enzyme family protein [Olavius algarvensis Delta 1 endosymbiont]
MNLTKEVLAAEQRIRPHIRETILDYSPYYSELFGANVYFKLENLQYTGSFKVRGAMNKVLSLTPAERDRGVVTASTGNHGAATAFSLGKFNAKGIVFVPEDAATGKVQAIERLGAEVRHYGDDGAVTEAHARQFAREHGMTYISPYNDPQVIGGQGTIAVELVQQQDHIDVLFAALGGGGLISGIAGHLKSIRPEIKIIGCSPKNSQIMIESIKAGRILDLPSLPTLSDGTAGGVEPDSITFDLCRELVDNCETVTETEIQENLRQYMQFHHMLIEGSAAVAVAACVKQGRRLAGKNVVVVLCGANIGLDTLKEIL